MTIIQCLCFVSCCFLGYLVFVQVVFLSEFHIPQKLGVHSLDLYPLLGRGLPGRITVVLPSLIMVSVILRLRHLLAENKTLEK